MPRQASVSVENNFSKGLITQATGLNFPENACTETFNCIFDHTGPVQRRFQFDFEDNYETETIDRSNKAISTFYWKGVIDGVNFTLLVMQVGLVLYFYDTDSPLGVSPNLLVDQIDMSTLVTAAANPEYQECQYHSGLGYLLVVHPTIEPFYVTYTPSTAGVASSTITVQIRDLTGVNDSLAVDSRPGGTITATHQYNLYNQGWNAPLNGTSPFAAWDTARADFPSNADVWWTFKDSTDVFALGMVANYDRGNTPAPKGHYVLDAFNQQRDTVSGVATVADVATTQRPSTVAFFAGRVFYAGVNDAAWNNKILYSQTIESASQFGYCYQLLDPTSEDLFELLPTDGGVLTIPNMGIAYRLIPFGSQLLVFASNGVWALSGSQGIGFSPVDYSVSFISSVKSISGTSFVDVDGIPMWWNINGIWTIAPDQEGGVQVRNLVNFKIDKFYREIPFLSKQQARGYYNPFTRIVQWLYRTTATSDLNTSYEYDAVLNYNLLSGAFYPWTIDSTAVPKIHALIVLDTGGQSLLSSFNVVDAAANLVVDASGNQVITYNLASYVTVFTTTKYLTSYASGGSYKFTFAESAPFDGQYKDFYKYNTAGYDYDSYFISGYKLRGDGQRKFQANYVYIFSSTHDILQNIVSSTTYDILGIWDYAITDGTGRWTSTQRKVHSSTDYNFLRHKIKMRGNGITLQFKVSSVSGEPFHLVGWSTYETQNAGI